MADAQSPRPDDVSSSCCCGSILATKPTIGLLDLPPEIRNRIYHYTLPVGRYYTLGDRGARANTVRDIYALSMVNRQLREETLPVFFGNAEFVMSLHSPVDLVGAVSWLSNLESRHCALIHDFTLYLKGVLRVHFSAQPDPSYARTSVELFTFTPDNPDSSPGEHPHGHSNVCNWVCTVTRRPLKEVVVRARALLNTIPAPLPGDSGLRVYHIARLLRIVLADNVLPGELRTIRRLSRMPPADSPSISSSPPVPVQ